MTKIRILYTIAITAVLLMVAGNSYSQRWKLRRYEANFGIGSAHYFGDIGGTADENNLFGLKDINILESRPSASLSARYYVQENVATRLNIMYGMMYGSDSESRNDKRAFDVSIMLFETSLVGEYYFISQRRKLSSASAIFGRRGQFNQFNSLTAYVFGGVGAFYSIPKLTATGNYSIPRATDNYPSSDLVINGTFPLGIGVKYSLDNQWSIGAEIGGRYTISDFVDGIQPAASDANDIYYFTSFSAILKLKNDRNSVPNIFKPQYGQSNRRRKPKRYKKPKPPRRGGKFFKLKIRRR